MTASDRGDGASAQRTFACPGCGAVLTAGTAACPSCGTRLVGDDAARLWTVNQQIATLQAEADRLLAALRPQGPVTTSPPTAPAPHGAPPPSGSMTGSMTTGMPAAPPLAPTGQSPRRPGFSGQGILLALGGLLLLSGAAVFVVVVWLLVGVYGQALLMVAFTCAAAALARVLGRRGLVAGAETLAVVACGLLLLDVRGAHHLDFAGLGGVPVWWYSAAAAVVCCACATLADRVTRPRRIAYAPFAAVSAIIAPWCVVAALDWTPGLRGVAVSGIAFLVDLVVLAIVVRAEGAAWRTSPAFILAGALVVLGLIAFVSSDIGLGFDTTRSRLVHVGAAVLGLLVPALVLAALALQIPRRLGVTGPSRGRAAAVVASFAAVSIAMVVFDAPLAVLLAAAVVAAVVVVAGAYWSVHATVRAVAVVAAGALGVLAFWVAIDHDRRWDVPGPVLALPAVIWVVAALVRFVSDREIWWFLTVEVAVALVVARVFAGGPAGTAMIGSAVVLVAHGVVAGVAARRPRTDPVRGRSTLASHVEFVSLIFAAGWAIATVALSFIPDDMIWAAIGFWVVGVVACAHASAPHRLFLAYPGALSVAAGVWVLLGTNDVSNIEAYSLPFAAMLAAIGLVQAGRGKHPSTLLTAGPALVVAVGPSLVAALGTGQAIRLAAVTIVGVVLVVVGLDRHWRAPVTAGVVTLVVVAVTQGGPLVAYVPSWLTLSAVGALLLVIGIRWEAAVGAGRRAGVWYAALR
ncbi:MAG TPA: zinc ribbon domain-containing protein [Marmoricola sp.]